MGKSTQELKYKRLKVGHACFVCRSKKIKCDGLRPCMQCKARGRNCQSSNSESTDQNENPSSLPNSDNESASNLESDDESILFSRTTSTAEQYNESWTSSTIHHVTENFKRSEKSPFCGAFPTFGSFVKWREEPPLPSKYTYPIEMPSSEIQMHLIDLYFETRYKITPMIPKRLFYQHLRTKGAIITPFLLNAIYCVVSGYSTLPGVPKPAVFYNRAKQLLDDFLDTPRVSTVAALCLLSLYEPVPTKTKNMSDQHCRSWMFSGMAFRMCLELGLNTDTPSARAGLSLEGIEFCRRVFWSCYCLDKMQSAEWERLWSIPSSLVKTAFPQVLPDDDEQEQWIVKAYEQKIRLSLIGEEGLQIRASFSIRTDIMDSKFHNQLENYRLKILKWREELSTPEAWGLAHCDTIEQVINEPKKSPVMSYLHIVYYFMLTDTLFCLPDNPHSSLEQRIYASQLTKSIETICDNPSLVIRYEFLAHLTITAIRVHARYLSDSDPLVSQQSQSFFHRCVELLRTFQKHAIIPECSAVLTHLPIICQNLTHANPPPAQHTVPSQYSSYDNNSIQVIPSQQNYQNQLVDPYRTDDISIPPAGYENMDNMNMASPYISMAAFGSSFGVDFANRRELWQRAIQNAMEERQPSLDLNSSEANSPENTIHYSTVPPQQDVNSSTNNSPIMDSTMNYSPMPQQPAYCNDWTLNSPVTTEFIWPAVTTSTTTASPAYKYTNYHPSPPQWHSPPSQQQDHMLSYDPVSRYAPSSNTTQHMHQEPNVYMNQQQQMDSNRLYF